MSQPVYEYKFGSKLPLKEVQESLFLAVLAVESLHGRDRIRLDTSFRLNKRERTCVVDGNTEIGCNIACIFTGFLSREFGEKAFQVKRVDGGNRQEPNNWQRIPGLFNKREIRQIKQPGKEYYDEPRGKNSWGLDVFALYRRDQDDKTEMGKSHE